MQSSLMLKPNGQGLYMMPECLGVIIVSQISPGYVLLYTMFFTL